MTGFFVVFVVAAGYGYWLEDPVIAGFGTFAVALYLVVNLLVITPIKMWSESQEHIDRLKGRLRPRLRLVFQPDVLPYLQRLTAKKQYGTKNPISIMVTHRILRVGIINESDGVIRNVRVVLESFARVEGDSVKPAETSEPILIEHAMNVMGRDRKSGFVSVAPSHDGKPTAFVDVVDQHTSAMATDGEYMFLQYAASVEAPIKSFGTYRFTLRVEGGGTASRAVFEVWATPEHKAIQLRPYSVA